MIDYLELLFLPEAEKREGGEEIPTLPVQKIDSETVAFQSSGMQSELREEEISTKPAEDVEVFFKKPVRIGEEAPVEDERTTGFVFSRSWARERPEELERRLKRVGRRYDSGFYRY